MKDEVVQAFTRHLRKESNDVHYLGSIQGVELFYDILYNGTAISRDAPDMVCIKDNTAIIIEHFEFDCYRIGNRGSKNKQEQARIEKKKKTIPIPKEGLVYTDTIQGENSYEDYVKNVTRSFNAHYQKIETYKQNLLNDGIITPGMDIKVSFLIEDVSPLPCMYKEWVNKSVKMRLIELAHSPEFLELFSKSPALDYVIACSSTSDGSLVWFIDRNEISAYKKEAVDYKNKEFLALTPHVIEVSYPI